jgi:hypothetical protein
MNEHMAHWRFAADDGWDPSIVLFLFLLSRKDWPLKVTPGLYCWLSERLYGTARFQDQVEEGLDELLLSGKVVRVSGEIRISDSYVEEVRWKAQQNDEALAAKKGWSPPKDFVARTKGSPPAPKKEASKTASFLDDWRSRQREALAGVVQPVVARPATSRRDEDFDDALGDESPEAPAPKKFVILERYLAAKTAPKAADAPRATFLTFKTFVLENADPETRLFSMRAYEIAKALGIKESSVGPWVRVLCDLGQLELVSAYDNKTKKPAVYRVTQEVV